MKELKNHKRSVLGFMWALLNPAQMMTVLTLLFSTIMRFTIPHYAIFLSSALLPWTFFSQSHNVNILDEIMPEAGAFWVMGRGYIEIPDQQLHTSGADGHVIAAFRKRLYYYL